MFGKKKKVLFGGNIPPSCEYCLKNAGSSDEVICTLKLEMKNGKCKKYVYNPLMRKPRPKVQVRNDFSKDDFKL